jgi:hypothetical protein
MKPCTRCGRCCSAEICDVGIEALSRAGINAPSPPCPLLIDRAGVCSCAVVEEERKLPHPKVTAAALGIGMGCDADAIALAEWSANHDAT